MCPEQSVRSVLMHQTTIETAAFTGKGMHSFDFKQMLYD